MSSDSEATGARGAWLGPAAIAATALAMLALAWRAWADPLVDFGGELYVAWRIAEGDVLYRDLAYFTGPLSPHVNAALFAAFGVGLSTLTLANGILLALITWLLHALCARMGDRFSAAAACVAFLSLCGLAVHQGGGNYNFLCPYSHETVHATLLSFAALLVFERWSRAPRAWTAALAGSCLGLVFLTKVEFAGALGAGLALGLAAARVGGRTRLAHAGVALAAALAPPCAALALLGSRMPAGEALRGVLGAWVYLGDERVGGFPLYRIAMGLEPLGHHLGRLALWTLGTLASVAAATFAARRWGTRTLLAAGVATAAALFVFVPWVDALYPASLYMLAALVWSWRQRMSCKSGALRVAFSAFALVLLTRIGLNARVQFYGFALAAPALALGIVALLSWIPASLALPATRMRAALVPLLAALVVGHLVPMRQGLARTTFELGVGRDALRCDPRGQFLANALELVARRCPPGGTVLVLPEGAMIDYLARRRAPGRYFNFMPPELAMFGERHIVAELSTAPPELVVLVHRDTLEYGVPYFGRDYGVELNAWVRANYRPLKLWSARGNEKPLEPGTLFAVAVLERKR